MEVIVRSKEALVSNHNKLSSTDRAGLEQKKRDLEEMKKDPLYGRNVSDPGAVDSEINRLGHILQEDANKVAIGNTKDALTSRRKELEDVIKKVIPPMNQQYAVVGSKDYEKAVSGCMDAQKPEFVNLCNEYQDICRRLEPENPNAGSVTQIVGD